MEWVARFRSPHPIKNPIFKIKPDFVRSQTIGFYIKTLNNPIAKNQGLPPLVESDTVMIVVGTL
jgi:hypothetical protein